MNAVEVIAALRKAHYAQPAWGFIEQVGNATGFGTMRHADALAMSLWPSRGLELHGIEVKVSRADWKRELAKPDKAEPIASRCDRWYIATPAGLIDPLSLPPAWGLLEVRADGKIATLKAADKLEPKPLDRSFLAAIMRQMAASTPTLDMQREARREAQADEEHRVADLVSSRTSALRSQYENLKTRVEQYEAATGVSLEAGRGYGPSGEDIGRAVAFLARGGMTKVEGELKTIDYLVERLTAFASEARSQLSVEDVA